jgi:hypothetical protein
LYGFNETMTIHCWWSMLRLFQTIAALQEIVDALLV